MRNERREEAGGADVASTRVKGLGAKAICAVHVEVPEVKLGRSLVTCLLVTSCGPSMKAPARVVIERDHWIKQEVRKSIASGVLIDQCFQVAIDVMDETDLTNCPGDFSMAYEKYRTSCRDLWKVAKNHGDDEMCSSLNRIIGEEIRESEAGTTPLSTDTMASWISVDANWANVRNTSASQD